jgi:hypothetical protein
MSAKQLERAVEAGDLVEAFKSFGVTQADVAQVTRTDPKTVYAWRASNTRPRSATYDRLDGLREVVRTLADSLTPRGVSGCTRATGSWADGARWRCCARARPTRSCRPPGPSSRARTFEPARCVLRQRGSLPCGRSRTCRWQVTLFGHVRQPGTGERPSHRDVRASGPSQKSADR